MSADERILRTLATFHSGLCDDCLSVRAEVRPRQQVQQRTARLHKKGRTTRERGLCLGCGRVKLVSSIENPASVASRETVAIELKEGRARSSGGTVRPLVAGNHASTESGSQLAAGRVDALTSNFDRCLEQFYSSDKFPHSSYYFHARTIALLRERPYRDVLSSSEFFEMVYATLATWGLDRMGVGKRLNEFGRFKQTILKEENVEILLELSGAKLQEITDEEAGHVEARLRTLFDGLADVMLTESKLVGVSKTMHHLLPDLVPPMDRAYTLNFFYQRHYLSTPPILGSENAKFVQMLGHFRKIARARNLTAASLTRRWDTSVPKMIDNAIIGFVDLNMKREA